eukprot:Nk52_evm20s490 gene=Nk52_evmTU20s490
MGMGEDDFVMTIEDDEEVDLMSESEGEDDANDASRSGDKPVQGKKQKNKKNSKKNNSGDKESANPSNDKEKMMEMSFDFEEDEMSSTSWNFLANRYAADESAPNGSTSIGDKIKAKLMQKSEAGDSDEEEEREDEDEEMGSDLESDGEENESSEEEEGEEEDEEKGDNESEDSDEEDDEIEEQLADDRVVDKFNTEMEDDEEEGESFFSKAPEEKAAKSFAEMNLCRPLMKACTALGYVVPTPVQSRCIPVGMMGKDICACAETGSGKTAAFLLPILERLIYRPKKTPASRVLVLSPTRELAAQCFSVCEKLCQFTDIQSCLIVGGLPEKAQVVELKKRPDIIIATPGRLIDHVHNCPSFTLDNIEVLIMDEADRLLELGFKDEVDEIIKNCGRGRQTMLFSATMTDAVEDLISLSLNEPVRLFVDGNQKVNTRLTQEFVRVRSAKENHRDAILVSLCKRTFKSNCIIFFRSKKAAHRLRIVFGLVGLQAAELHGDLNQTERLESLENFKAGKVDYLLATDLAGRGIDISGVNTVINFSMPNNLTQYIHRVGRTARAGKKGRSVTLVGESERKLLKEIVKSATDPIKSRIIPEKVVEAYRKKIEKMEKDVNDILKLEKEEKMLRCAQMEENKARNLIVHREEILSKPAKQWFQNEKEKQLAKEQGKKVHQGEVVDAAPVKGAISQPSGKDSLKNKLKKMDPEEANAIREQLYHLRQGKKQGKGKKVRNVFDEKETKMKMPVFDRKPGALKSKGFDKDLTDVSKSSVKQLRGAKGPQKRGASQGGPEQKKKFKAGAVKKFKSQKKFKRRK